MNCEHCHTPMIWIGSLSRGGLDCPKCASERPVYIDFASGKDSTVYGTPLADQAGFVNYIKLLRDRSGSEARKFADWYLGEWRTK